MKTRKDYLAGKCTHQEYYAQFITPRMIARVKSSIGEKAIKESTDPHFNDIPLKRWDNLGLGGWPVNGNKMKECGDYLTLAGGVCIAKAIARQIRDGKI